MLEVADDYLGRPALFHGATLKREAPDGRTGGVRMRHRDVEDGRVFRILIYLSDVDEGHGPFQCIDAAASDRIAVRLRYGSGYVSCDRIAPHANEHEQRSASGATCSAILFDGARVFHRAQPPTLGRGTRSPCSTPPARRESCAPAPASPRRPSWRQPRP